MKIAQYLSGNLAQSCDYNLVSLFFTCRSRWFLKFEYSTKETYLELGSPDEQGPGQTRAGKNLDPIARGK